MPQSSLNNNIVDHVGHKCRVTQDLKSVFVLCECEEHIASSIRVYEVDSSNLKEVCMVKDDLFVTFHHGGTYIYHGVPDEVFEDMLEAESVGKYFNACIKDIYEFEKLG